MPLQHYGVLKGRILDAQPGRRRHAPHYYFLVRARDTLYRVTVNVRSQQSPADLLCCVVDDFRHPMLSALRELPAGFIGLPHHPEGMALDYVRGRLFDPAQMQPVPTSLPGVNNDLNDALEAITQEALGDHRALLYAFGQRWGPERRRDRVFRFRPGNGVHDVHMNQGNTHRFAHTDGVWQDGGLLVHFGAEERWVAVFLAFQSQAWGTDDRTGQALAPRPRWTVHHARQALRKRLRVQGAGPPQS